MKQPGWVRIPCSHAHRLLSERVDRPLSLGERLRLRLHLAICDVCTRFSQQLSMIRSGARRLGR